MILWHVTGINGWAERLLVESRLKRNVTDLSDHDERYAEGVGVECARQLERLPTP